MPLITRRTALQLGASAAALGASGDFAFAQSAIKTADATPPKLDIEKGATLRMLRPARFVPPDEENFRANCAKFAKDTGVDVKVDFVGWEDITQQTAVTANTARARTSLSVSTRSRTSTPTSLSISPMSLSTSASATAAGCRWRRSTARSTTPITGSACRSAVSGGPLVWRKSAVNAAGYDAPPDDLGRYLDLCRKLHAAGKPPGFALGNAVGDGNGFANWLIWAHGGFLVDEDNTVAINRKPTIEALKYLQELYKTFVPGTTAWNDISNNRAYAASEIWLTANGVSMYSRQAGREAGSDRRGHPAQPAAQGSPERVADGRHDDQRHGLPAQQVPECLEGSPPVPA